VWSIAVGIHLILLLYIRAGLISLNDVAYLGGDLLLLADFSNKWLVNIILLQRFKSISANELVCFYVNSQVRRYLELPFVDGSWIDLSLPKPLVQFNCDLIWEYLNVVLGLCLQIHQQLGVDELVFILNISFDLILFDDVAFHEVDGNDVDLNL
jgi:hypothetical protein